MNALVFAALVFAAFAGMEWVAWFTHRYLMHGALWCWHASHHAPRRGLLELNDLFAAIFATPAVGLIGWGVWGRHPAATALGIGITLYGAAYALFHDGLVHARFRTPLDPRGRYMQRLVQAHKIHHAVQTKGGGVSFGFLVAPSQARLKAAREKARAAAG